jgi:hypothetical protein
MVIPEKAPATQAETLQDEWAVQDLVAGFAAP